MVRIETLIKPIHLFLKLKKFLRNIRSAAKTVAVQKIPARGSHG